MIFGKQKGITTEQEIGQLIAKPLNGDNIKTAIAHHKKLNMHVNGVGVTEHLAKIENLESPEKLTLRKQVARSNRAVYSTLLRDFDQIFSAKGGSVDYLLGDQGNKKMSERLSNVANGLSLHKWVENKWTNKFVTDPQGITFIEVNGKKAYPTYKAITTIHDYKLTNGTGFEYLILKAEQKEWMKDGVDYYRVVDDAFDYMVKYEGEKAQILEGYSFTNHFKEVPARTNSDLLDPTLHIKASPIDATLELADEYLRDCSIHSIYKFLHGYPIFWAYLPDCPVCMGQKQVDGKPCPACHGTGKKLKKDVSDIMALTVPEGDETKISPDVAGYVAPELPTWTKQVEELEWLSTAMDFVLWGTDKVASAENETATKSILNVQPKHNALNKFSDSAESMERWAVRMIGKYYMPKYKGGSINYGRRFLIEPADMILSKLGTAIKDGLPEVTKMYYQKQYYQAEFQNDARLLARYMRLIDVEPWPFQSLQEIKDLEIDTIEFYRKVYYLAWLAQITEDEILSQDKKQLQLSLTNYAKIKTNERKSEESARPEDV